ncbi:MAG: glucosaminidase domain-containing protein [Lachnospiraceae bacterium]|nr:glucosaminidase domain-containing protein [Lachnospiraceae bacterium]
MAYVYHYITCGKNEGRIADQQILYTIMGSSNVTVSQMVAYYNANAAYPSYYGATDAPTIEQFCQIYLEECNAEGVKAEVAFSQAMKETGFLRYGGDVSINQHNFAGLGATGNGAAGASFSSVREGVRAQVQHLKAYASTEPLNNPCVDGRFQYVTRGTAPYVEWLGINENPYGKGWATATGYGYSMRDGYIYKLCAY